MIKHKTKINETVLTTYAFHVFRKCFIVARSSRKWQTTNPRKGIFMATVGGTIPTLFIGKIAIGYANKTDSSFYI